jgi:bacterial leucyl aminopeptidase
MVRSLALAALAATGVTARTLPVRAEPELFTVEVSPGDVRQVTQEGKFELVRQGEEFIDITDHPGLASGSANSFAGKGKAVNYPGNVTHQAAVESLIADISLSNMEDNLIPYTEFPTRYYTSQDGADASDWLLEKVRGVLGDVGSAEPYEHRFVQNSIIATIPGKSDKKIVVGGHLDSINGAGPSAPAPGAGKLFSLFVILPRPLKLHRLADDGILQ